MYKAMAVIEMFILLLNLCLAKTMMTITLLKIPAMEMMNDTPKSNSVSGL